MAYDLPSAKKPEICPDLTLLSVKSRSGTVFVQRFYDGVYLILSIVCRQRFDLAKYQGNLKRMPAKQHEDASAYFERIGKIEQKLKFEPGPI